MGVHVPQGEMTVLGFVVPIGFNGVFLNRSVIDSCVKNWQYFRTDNISLKSTVHLLSEDTVRFWNWSWDLREICKMHQSFYAQIDSSSSQAASFYANVVMATIASLPAVHLFCAVWAILASLWEHLTCRCLHVVHSSLIALRYSKFGPIWLIVVEGQCM